MDETLIQVKRHYRDLSSSEMREMIEAVAELLVDCLKSERVSQVPEESRSGQVRKPKGCE